MTLPAVLLVGRPNVGKSTLFNRLVGKREALVHATPGLTRDRLIGRVTHYGKQCLLIDSAGLEGAQENLAAAAEEQVWQAVSEADQIWLVVDVRAGLSPGDSRLAAELRRQGRTPLLVANKAEGLNQAEVVAEFAALGFSPIHAVSAKRGQGIPALMDTLPVVDIAAHPPELPQIAVVGRPNVGKSTLVNRLVGAPRVLVGDVPGTTRDSVRLQVKLGGRDYQLFDTAGLRSRSQVRETVEKFSLLKTLQSIEQSQTVLLVIEAPAGVTRQDVAIIGIVRELGKSMLLVINKCDCITDKAQRTLRRDLLARLNFLPTTELIFGSALKPRGLPGLAAALRRTHASGQRTIATASLNRTLQQAVTRTPPPLYRRRPIRLKFIHQSATNPPTLRIRGSQAERLPVAYLRYLSRYFSERYELVGTPLKIIPDNEPNPYAPSTGRSRRANRQ